MALSISRRLVYRLACAVVFLLVSSLSLHGQDDPPSDPSSSAASPLESSSSSAAGRDVSLNLLPGNFLRDQQNIWFSPRELAKGRYWSPTVNVVAATLALLSSDPYVPLFQSHHSLPWL